MERKTCDMPILGFFLSSQSVSHVNLFIYRLVRNQNQINVPDKGSKYALCSDFLRYRFVQYFICSPFVGEMCKCVISASMTNFCEINHTFGAHHCRLINPIFVI